MCACLGNSLVLIWEKQDIQLLQGYSISCCEKHIFNIARTILTGQADSRNQHSTLEFLRKKLVVELFLALHAVISHEASHVDLLLKDQGKVCIEQESVTCNQYLIIMCMHFVSTSQVTPD